MVGETNSMVVDYKLMAEGHSVQLGGQGDALSPSADQGKHPGGG